MAGKEFAFGFILSAALSNGFANSFGTAGKYMTKLREETAKYEKVLRLTEKAQRKGIIDTESYKNAVTQMRPEIDALARKQEQYVSSNNKLSENAEAMKKYLLGISGAGFALFNGPIQSAIQFESTMADVRKVVDFETPGQFQQMSKDIMDLSNRIPMTAEGLGQIVAAGGQSGIARGDLLSFAESAAKMGVAFDITADQAGTMMAQWRTAFKMGQSDVVALADKINYLGNTTAASAPLISDVITRVGPLGEVGGVASGEIAALGASLVGAGINSDVAATGIKNLILAMASGESATKTQQEAFASLGIDTVELAQRMQTDAKGAILDVLQSISRLDKAAQASTLQNIFGKESLGAIAPLLSNLDGLKENFNKVADSAKYAGSMEMEFDTRSKTAGNSIQLMTNRMNNAMISIGTGLLPVLVPMVEIMGEGAAAIGKFSAEHPTLVRNIVLAAGAFAMTAVAVRGYRMAVAGINMVKLTYNGITNISIARTYAAAAASKTAAIATRALAAAQWMWNLALRMSPFGMMTIGIMALIAAGSLLYQNWDTIKNFFVTLWNDPARALSDFGAGVMAKFQSLYDWVMDKWAALTDFLSHPIDTAVNFVSGGGAVAANAAGGIYGKGAFLTTFAEDGPEAAIPLTPSRRSVGLWAEAGERLGTMPDSGILNRGIPVPRAASSGGAVTVDFRPQVTIQGNADAAVVQQAMTVTVQQLRRMLEDIAHNGRRLSYE